MAGACDLDSCAAGISSHARDPCSNSRERKGSMYGNEKRRDVLLLLSAGVPQQRIAALTRVSVRTIRRITREPSGPALPTADPASDAAPAAPVGKPKRVGARWAVGGWAAPRRGRRGAGEDRACLGSRHRSSPSTRIRICSRPTQHRPALVRVNQRRTDPPRQMARQPNPEPRWACRTRLPGQPD